MKLALRLSLFALLAIAVCAILIVCATAPDDEPSTDPATRSASRADRGASRRRVRAEAPAPSPTLPRTAAPERSLSDAPAAVLDEAAAARGGAPLPEHSLSAAPADDREPADDSESTDADRSAEARDSDEAKKQRERERVHYWNQRGIELSGEGRAAEAVEAFAHAVELDPNDDLLRNNLAVARGNLGAALFKEGKGEEAEAVLLEALKELADDAVLHLNLASAIKLQGYPEREAKLVRKAVELDPKLPEARQRLGDILIREGQLAGALLEWERAVELFGEREPGAAFRQKMARARAAYEVEKTLTRRLSAHFEILFDLEQHGVLAENVLRELEEAHALVAADLKHFGPAQLKVVLLSSEQFQVSTGAHGWVGGLFDGQIRLPVKGADNYQEHLLAKARHEYVHAVLAPLGARSPSWLHEGLAQIFERVAPEPVRARVAAAGTLEYRELTESFSRTRSEDLARRKYDTSLAFTAWLREGRRAGSFRAAIAALFRGATLDAAFRDAYRKDLPTLYDEFVASM